MGEQRLKGEGLGLHDLAVFAATLSNLVHQEAVGKLQTIFDAMDFPTDGEIPQAQSEIAVTNFVIRGLLGLGKREAISDDLTKYMHKAYPDWDNLRAWVADFTQTRDTMMVRNPFLQQSHSFDTSAALVAALSQNFGKYQNLECMSLKGRLVDMDQHGTGRVLLRDFYDGYENNPLHHFAESVDYLRNVGALDETDPQRLSVMIPNYLMGKANCFSQSGFYATCCSNECEGLLRHVEDSLASASAHRRCDFGFAIRHGGCSAQSFVNFTRSLGRDCQAKRWRGAFAWSIVLAMDAPRLSSRVSLPTRVWNDDPFVASGMEGSIGPVRLCDYGGSWCVHGHEA